jgi:hypothetical protein
VAMAPATTVLERRASPDETRTSRQMVDGWPFSSESPL